MLNKKNHFRQNVILSIFLIVFLAVSFFPLTVNATNKLDVVTRSVSFISDNDATLNGSVDGNNASTRVWFEYGTSKNMTKVTSKESIGDDYKEFSIDIENLRNNTMYYYRAVAKNSEGTDYGEILSFRTGEVDDNYHYSDKYSSSLTATTVRATEVSANSAQINSLITDSGNSFISSWFEWGTTPRLGTKTEVMPVGATSSIRHAHTLSGLLPNTTYYFRAVAENTYWRNNGTPLSFTTSRGDTVQNRNINYIIEEPAPTTTIEIPTTSEPTEIKIVPPKKTESVSSLTANSLEAGSFLPRTIIGWVVLVVLVLLLIILVKNLQAGFTNKKSSGQNHG